MCIAAVDDILGSTYLFDPLPRCTCSCTADSLSCPTPLLLAWEQGGTECSLKLLFIFMPKPTSSDNLRRCSKHLIMCLHEFSMYSSEPPHTTQHTNPPLLYLVWWSLSPPSLSPSLPSPLALPSTEYELFLEYGGDLEDTSCEDHICTPVHTSLPLTTQLQPFLIMWHSTAQNSCHDTDLYNTYDKDLCLKQQCHFCYALTDLYTRFVKMPKHVLIMHPCTF